MLETCFYSGLPATFITMHPLCVHKGIQETHVPAPTGTTEGADPDMNKSKAAPAINTTQPNMYSNKTPARPAP